MGEEKTCGIHALASKLRVHLQTGTSYAMINVVPKAKVILPYILLYYVFPSVASLAYTLIAQKYTVHHLYMDTQNLNCVEVCVEMPTLIVPGGTQFRNMKVKVGFGESSVHAFTLVSHSLHEWKHHQRMYIHENMTILHNEEFEAKDATAFMRERKNAWLVLEFDLGVNVLLGSVYFRVSLRKSIDIFGDKDAKVFDIVSGIAAEEDKIITATVLVRPRIPAFMHFFSPRFSLEAYGMIGGENAMACRLFAVSVESFQWSEHSATIPCTVRISGEDIKNIKSMVQSLERRVEKNTIVFRSSNIDAFSDISREYINAVLLGIVVEPTDNDNLERRRELEEPLIRIGISKITPGNVEGFIAVHRALFTNAYIYELVRNVRYENFKGQVNLEEVKIADGYFHNRAEHPDQYVRCEFWGEIHNWAVLICRVLNPDGQVLSIRASDTHSMISCFLGTWSVFVDFRKGVRVTSLGCMQPQPRPAKKSEGQRNNTIKIHSRVVESTEKLLRISTTIHTKNYRASPFVVLEVSEDQSFMIPSSLIQTNISIKKSELTFNIEESVGRIVSIGRPAEIDVVFEKLGNFIETDRSRSTVDESIYHLLVFVLCRERGKDCDLIERTIEDYVKKSCTGHALGMKKASVMVQEILGYDKYKVLFTFQGDAMEDAFVNIELGVPSVELNMFPMKDGQMIRKAFVKTKIEPFTLGMQVDRRGVALQETETILPLSIHVKFSSDLMAKRFTFMYNNENTLLSCLINFCLNFFQGSLDMFSSIKHEKRGHEDIKNFSSTVPEVLLDVNIDMKPKTEVSVILQIPSKNSKGPAFSIDTEKIKISVVKSITKDKKSSSNESLENMLSMEVYPLGINLRQKNNENFCHRDICISVWSKVCILDCDQYECTIEYGEKDTGDSTKHARRFVITKQEVIAIALFMWEFYGNTHKQEQEATRDTILQRIYNIVRSLLPWKKKAKKSANSKPKVNMNSISFTNKYLSVVSGGNNERRQQMVRVQSSYGLLWVDRIIGSIVKRINLERYPKTLLLRTTLRILSKNEEKHEIFYEMIVDDLPIMYQDPYLRRCDDDFTMRLICDENNKLMLKTLSCKSDESSFLSLLSSVGLFTKVFIYDQQKNMYFGVFKTDFKADMDLCIEVYSEQSLSFKLSTKKCIQKDNITILPLFIVPLNFNKKKHDITVKVYVDNNLLHSLKIQTGENPGALHIVLTYFIKNPLWNFEGALFAQNDDIDIDENEFASQFEGLSTPIA